MEKRFHVRIWCLILIWMSHCSASCGTYEGFVADVLNRKLLHLSGFPWLVSLQDLSGFHLEVGTIISEFWIVAAPSGLKMRQGLVAVVGITKLGSKELEARSRYPIRKVIVHQKFDEILGGNDLMLLMTEEKMTFGRNVQPVCFPSRDPDNSALTNCQVSGWRGPGAAGITSSEAWHRLSVDNIDPCPLKRTKGTECCSHHAQASNAMVTEGDPVTCQVVGSDRWVLAGILTGGGLKSYGPFLYTRTSYYSDWVSACTKEEGEAVTTMVSINTEVQPGARLAQERSAVTEIIQQSYTEKSEALYYDYYNGNPLENSNGHQAHPSVPLMLCIVLLVTYIKTSVLCVRLLCAPIARLYTQCP